MHVVKVECNDSESTVLEVLSGLRVPLPRPISEEYVVMAPEELGRGGAGC